MRCALQERGLAALQAMPRVIGVFVIRPEHELEHALRIGADLRAVVARAIERAGREDAAEIEEHCADAGAIGARSPEGYAT